MIGITKWPISARHDVVSFVYGAPDAPLDRTEWQATEEAQQWRLEQENRRLKQALETRNWLAELS